MHAREWITPAFMTWMIHELVENYAAHPQYVDNLDWYLIPVLNPDGYRYTFAPDGVRRLGQRASAYSNFYRIITIILIFQDRLWRKNRDPNPGSPCIGAV